MRIAFLGIEQESSPFSPILTRESDFLIWRGDEMLRLPGVAGTLYPSGRTVADRPPELADMVRELEIEPVPIFFARQMEPGGAVEEATYLRFREEIVDGLRRAGKVDGVCLLQHGAMVVENIWYGDTDLARSVRGVVGLDPLLAARFDLHANVTEEWANTVDLWAAFRTAPHRDAPETLVRALRGLITSLRDGRRPRPAFARLPMLLSGEKATTDTEPMRSLLATVRKIELAPGILNAELMVGFAWQDTAYAGASLVVVARSEEDLPLARREARRLAADVWNCRAEFVFRQEVGHTIDEAIDLALDGDARPVFIADSGDNAQAGAPGDLPLFLSRLLARDLPDAVCAGVPDAQAARACLEVGVGATVTLEVGARLDTVHARPVHLTGVVEHLYRPAPGSAEAAVATVRVGGVRVLIPDRRKTFAALDDFRKAGIEAGDHRIVVVKLGYLAPELRDLAAREILAVSPGYVDQELGRLSFRHVTRPIYPLDRDFEWRPWISNTAGYVD